jgi:hypothetical protein
MPPKEKKKKTTKTKQKQSQSQRQTVNIRVAAAPRRKKAASKPAPRAPAPVMTQSINLSSLFPPPPQYYTMLKPTFTPTIPTFEAAQPIAAPQVIAPPVEPIAAPRPPPPEPEPEPFVMVNRPPPPPPPGRGTLAGRIARGIGRGALAGIEALGEINLPAALPPMVPRLPEMAPVRIQAPHAPVPVVAPAPEVQVAPEAPAPARPRFRLLRRRALPEMPEEAPARLPEMAPVIQETPTQEAAQPDQARFRLARRRVKLTTGAPEPYPVLRERLARQYDLPPLVTPVETAPEPTYSTAPPGPSRPAPRTRAQKKKALDPEEAYYEEMQRKK